jgi:hypothetical protein
MTMTIARKAKSVAVITAVVFGLLVINGVYRWNRERNSSRVSGLAAVSEVGWDPISLWKQQPSLIAGAVETAMEISDRKDRSPESVRPMMYVSDSDKSDRPAEMVVRTVRLELEVDDVQTSITHVQDVVETMSGVVENMRRAEGNDRSRAASLSARVPQSSLMRAANAIKRVAVIVRSEDIETRDVRKDWTDEAARLHALKAEEQEYLVLLRRTTKVSEVLVIDESLGRVRKEIEAREGVLRAFQNDVQMSQVSVTLTSKQKVEILGIDWHPKGQLKTALHEALEGLASWGEMVIALIVKLPILALWFVTVVGFAWILWRLLRWTWVSLFAGTR